MIRGAWLHMTNKEVANATNDETSLTEHAICQSTRSLEGKTVIVTGGNSGIGKECCRDFIRRGARVILACRSLTRGNDAKLDIEQDTGIFGNLIVMIVDLSSLKSVRQFAKEFKEKEKRLDILLNNAGLVRTTNRFSEDGFEATMATNHTGHFLLTYLLIDMLKSCAPSRVVNVTSIGHYSCDDMMFENFHNRGCCGSSQFKLYSRSKAANILFAQELTRRFSKDGVTAYSAHPGFVLTNFNTHFSACSDCFYVLAVKCCMRRDQAYVKSAEQGAQTPIHCCVTEEIEHEAGSYYHECKVRQPSKLCRDEKNALRLWDISSELVGATW
ncbi:DgyrCDS14423 [Dimorphilus gyrociliatus]|uniref:DgyrCDS14423 n=1 Tax=Dimorphilus gyrociliatus TaxID=2664684 RepID=A0A7I8WDJ7_9ANNE|nr:DgyrCDS14423 [Dimorphilus gyrociliatus]